MRKACLLILFVATLTACKNESCLQSCGVSNPAQDLPWLKQLIENHTPDSSADSKEYYPPAEIVSHAYKGKTVYLVDMCMQCPDNLTTVVNCEGQVICEFGGIAGRNTCPDFSEATRLEVVWKR
jgi:hypothetical protein